MHMIVALLVLSLLAPRHPLAEYQYIGKKNGLRLYAFFVDGLRTPVVEKAGDGEGPPTVDAHRTPKGIVYGYTDQTVDGAYLASFDDGFVYRKGKLRWFDGVQVLAANGDYILFLPILEGMPPQSSGCDKGMLYYDGKTWNVGYIRRAKLSKSGVVTGWYPVVDGKPYTNAMTGDNSPAPTPGIDVVFKRRYFKFEKGKRTEAWSPIS